MAIQRTGIPTNRHPHRAPLRPRPNTLGIVAGKAIKSPCLVLIELNGPLDGPLQWLIRDPLVLVSTATDGQVKPSAHQMQFTHPLPENRQQRDSPCDRKQPPSGPLWLTTRTTDPGRGSSSLGGPLVIHLPPNHKGNCHQLNLPVQTER